MITVTFSVRKHLWRKDVISLSKVADTINGNKSLKRLMSRYFIGFLFSLLLVGVRAEAIEERDICWRGVCAGMTMPEVKTQLKSLGFKVHDNRLSRWAKRWLPQIGGVFDYERYVEFISATRGAECKPISLRQPCSSVSLGFVRFPSGRHRLINLQYIEMNPMKRLVSEEIKDMKTVLGPPDRATWEKQRVDYSNTQWTFWNGFWSAQNMGDWVGVDIYLVEDVNVEEGTLSPPDMVEKVHIRSIDFSLHAHTMVGRAAQTAWKGEKADWITDRRTGCRVWNNYPSKTDTVSWNGPCVNGYASGYGTVRWSEFEREYEIDKGEFRRGKLNGHATITAEGKVYFEGEFRNNLPNGHGTLKKNGKVYSGNWSKGCFNQNGKRTEFFTDRDKCNNY